ncbi:MAG: hypothetical protein ABUL72_00445, partial [Armatimonadota bacterium]
ETAKATAMLSNGKIISNGMLMMSLDNDDKLPDISDKAAFLTKLNPYISKYPTAVASVDSFEFNSALATVPLTKIADPHATWMLHSQPLGYKNRQVVCFADSSCRLYSESEAAAVEAGSPVQIPDSPAP